MSEELLLRCQKCKSELREIKEYFECIKCNMKYPIKDGIVFMGYDIREKKYINEVLEHEKYHHANLDTIDKQWEFAIQGGFKYAKLAVNNLLLNIDQSPDEMNVLEFGAGSGYCSWILANSGFNVYTTELEPNMLYTGLIYKHPKLGLGHRIVCDARIPPFESNTFDIIFCKELVHHIPNKFDFFLQCNNLLKDGGYLVFLEPLLSLYKVFYLIKNPETTPDHFYVTLANYIKSIQRAGFSVYKYGIINYKEYSKWIFINTLKKLFNNEIMNGVTNYNYLAKFFYAQLIGGSVLFFAKKKFNRNYLTKFSDIEIINPSYITIDEEFLNRCQKFYSLLKEIDNKYTISNSYRE